MTPQLYKVIVTWNPGRRDRHRTTRARTFAAGSLAAAKAMAPSIAAALARDFDREGWGPPARAEFLPVQHHAALHSAFPQAERPYLVFTSWPGGNTATSTIRARNPQEARPLAIAASLRASQATGRGRPSSVKYVAMSPSSRRSPSTRSPSTRADVLRQADLHGIRHHETPRRVRPPADPFERFSRTARQKVSSILERVVDWAGPKLAAADSPRQCRACHQRSHA